MIAFLIDADNFSSPSWIDEAFQTLERTEGSVSIRRAYGSPENLKGLADALRGWAVRPFVNLPLPKNTTDMSLAVDAMELACLSPRPKVMVIGSGDLDFVPLVVRLREKGIKVVCVSERGKMAQDALRAYDQVIYVGVEQVVGPVNTVKVSLPSTEISARAIAKKPTVKAPSAKMVAQKSPAVATGIAKKGSKKANGVLPEDVTVTKILGVIPGLKSGKWQALGDIAKTLHDKELLAKSATSTKLLKKFPNHFELAPAGKPNKVRFIL